MRNNTRKCSGSRRRSTRKPEAELQWLEDGVNAFVKYAAIGLLKAGEFAVVASTKAVTALSARK